MKNEKNLKKLQRLFQAMDEDSLTRAEFTDQFKKVLDFIVKLKAKNQAEFTNLNQSISDLADKIKGDNSNDIVKLKGEANKTYSGLSAKLRKIIDDKISSIRDGIDGIDGKDADIEETARKALELIQEELRQDITQSGEDIKSEFGDKIKDILGLFSGKGKLKKAIKKLKKEIEELRKMRTVYVGGGGVGKHNVVAYDLSASLSADGSVRTFNLPSFWKIVSINLSSFPNILRPDVDFTISGHAITFTAEIPANSISLGQTCIVLYSE